MDLGTGFVSRENRFQTNNPSLGSVLFLDEASDQFYIFLFAFLSTNVVCHSLITLLRFILRGC
jgi:hypothetical protein